MIDLESLKYIRPIRRDAISLVTTLYMDDSRSESLNWKGNFSGVQMEFADGTTVELKEEREDETRLIPVTSSS